MEKAENKTKSSSEVTNHSQSEVEIGLSSGVEIQQYPNYKPSGVTWLGEIPEHWGVKKFKFVLNQSKGLTITKHNLGNEGVCCVNYGEIHSKYGFELDITKHKLKCVNKEYLKTDSNSLLNKGDFVFADTSEDIEGSGNFTHLKSSDKIFAGYHTVIARPKIEIESLFLAFVFDSTSFRNQIRKKVKGVKVYSITQSVLKETNIWIPLLQEQIAIAHFLDDKTTKIDEAIAIKEQQINLLKERKQILIHKAVTRGVGSSSGVEMKDSGVEWIGKIPAHWEVKKLFGICDFVRGNSPFSKDELLSTGDYVALQYGKTYKVDEIDDKYNFYVNDEFYKESQIVNFGDTILVSTSETIEDLGHSAYYNRSDLGLLGGEQMVLKPKKEKLDGHYLYFISKIFSKELRKYATGIKVFRFNVNNLKTIYASVPPLSEQKEISAYIETASKKIETAIGLKQQEIAKLKEYKSSIINSVVTGKVKVC
ncbi:type I restriction enzyme S subunit [Wenyingzhuangia heitensis]|uniref:Type I restriction enzyme S subunit n=1 Tax=Wenyingzhuangia heitensis TaxID=1487859 RepID=A0ABX0U9Z9_9FLAO|nr:restriction endonuclease subunit S [Wenyingzhuangia heitensis]NIJ45649.1 type I restriction enzyme S subunit [Wenyingzhuangia heitensis]